MIALAEGFDTGILFQAAVVFAIFVLPVLRNIMQSRQKQRDLREKQRRGDLKAPPDKKVERKGLSDWERLLRGERVEVEKPKPPVLLEQLFPELVEDEPPPPPVETKARPKPRSVTKPAAQPLVARKERAADQSMQVDFESGLREREPRPALEAAFAGLGETDLTTIDDRPTVRTAPRRARVRPPLNWRRAVALSEVLGQPVSMRQGGAWPGTPRGT